MNKKKVHDWGSYIFVYIYLFLVVIIFSHIVVLLAKIDFYHTDIHNAREMLGVLFESQATIIALVITLTLVAVQLTASEYSPRVVDIFRKDPYMWTLFILYGISMLYDLILLKLVEGGGGAFEWHVSSALLFGTFTFFALIPFILHTINLLKPKNIVRRVSKDIAKDEILTYINDQEGHSKGGETSEESRKDSDNKPSMSNGDTKGHKNLNSNQKSKEKKKAKKIQFNQSWI